MRIVNISEAKASLSKLVESVLEGREVVIGKAGKPVAKLVPFERDSTPRDLTLGIWEGQVWLADDFDQLPEELMRSFAGDEPDEPAP